MSDINVKILIDNNTTNDDFISEHGLSMMISTSSKHILLDFGQTNKFIKNAQTLSVDINNIDIAVISHAHYDHTGGIDAFKKINKDCPIYARHGIDSSYFSKRPLKGLKKLFNKNKDYYLAQIGLTKSSRKHLSTFNIIESDTCIAEGIHILCDPEDKAIENTSLLMEVNNKLVPDKFMHESILVIEDDDCIHVFTGCCHRGVASTLDYAASKFDKPIKSIIGGLHLVGRGQSGINKTAAVNAAEAIKKYNVQNIYVGHCTKDKGYEYLKDIFDQTTQFAAGFEFEL